MEAKELRIGNFINYLLFPNILDSGIQVVVCRISESHVTFIENGEENTYAINNFIPIPLTEEWLIKFGYHTERVKY
ncbi:hypothetical protein [Chryseobacterium indologenes]|uniref:Uncharacterized protein n=1 Tax=Chryseobacterium indologenes TaxID=253 RepID=A0A0N0ZUF3_CHRID|nr:hypothetical protein [Chryseobacterium indologenes]KPE51016.1 hypothetical protein AOB46_12580 [Chryseobacterium indologenes]